MLQQFNPRSLLQQSDSRPQNKGTSHCCNNVYAETLSAHNDTFCHLCIFKQPMGIYFNQDLFANKVIYLWMRCKGESELGDVTTVKIISHHSIGGVKEVHENLFRWVAETQHVWYVPWVRQKLSSFWILSSGMLKIGKIVLIHWWNYSSNL
jgi:hypothetical protein